MGGQGDISTQRMLMAGQGDIAHRELMGGQGDIYIST